MAGHVEDMAPRAVHKSWKRAYWFTPLPLALLSYVFRLAIILHSVPSVVRHQVPAY